MSIYFRSSAVAASLTNMLRSFSRLNVSQPVSSFATLPVPRSFTPVSSILNKAQVRNFSGKNSSAAKKRFKVKASGKIQFNQCNRRHLAVHKSSNRIRRLGKKNFITNAAVKQTYKALLNH